MLTVRGLKEGPSDYPTQTARMTRECMAVNEPPTDATSVVQVEGASLDVSPLCCLCGSATPIPIEIVDIVTGHQRKKNVKQVCQVYQDCLPDGGIKMP